MRIVVGALLLSLVSVIPGLYAHEGGHGPRLTDVGQQGGIIAPVVDKKEFNKGSRLKVFYKAELVRLEEGNIAVYVYDNDMNPIKLSKFDKKAMGEVEAIVKKKVTSTAFKLAQEEDAFTGKAPKAPSKPFNIEITLNDDQRELFVVFENLD